MGTSSAPVFPFPGGTQGVEPADPAAGKPGHFAWSRWIKEFVKRLDRESVKISGDTMTGPLKLKPGETEVTIRVDGASLNVNAPIVASDPTIGDHVATKDYVDTRVPLYLEVVVSADSTGWANPAGLRPGAVVFSLLDVSAVAGTVPLMLNPGNNAIYVGPNTSRKVRIWYV